MDTTLYFPIGFNATLTIIGVGFFIYEMGRQRVNFTSTYLSTSSHIRQSAMNSYLAIGI